MNQNILSPIKLHCDLFVLDVDKYIEYIPSLCDIRSQRAVKLRLEALEKADKQKKEKQKEEKLRQEKITLMEQKREKRKIQRRQVINSIISYCFLLYSIIYDNCRNILLDA